MGMFWYYVFILFSQSCSAHSLPHAMFDELAPNRSSSSIDLCSGRVRRNGKRKSKPIFLDPPTLTTPNAADRRWRGTTRYSAKGGQICVATVAAAVATTRRPQEAGLAT